MSITYITSKKRKIKLSDQSLGKGGEGEIFCITSPRKYDGSCVKLFHPKSRNPEREKKNTLYG